MSGAWRGMRGLAVASCLAGGMVFTGASAHAFELFGVRLWGTADEEAVVVDPLRYAVSLDTGGADEALAQSLRAASSLVADEDRPVSGALGLIAKTRAEREQLVAALYEAARYDGTVEIAIAGRPLDDIPPDAEFSRPGPVPVSVRVTPGQAFRLGAIEVRGETGGIMPARFGLIPGAEAGSRAILKAEADIVRALREEGRPLAAISDRDIVADSRTGTVDVTLVVEAGPVAPFGETRVSGTQDVDRDFTRSMAGIAPGRAYSPKELEEARERLSNLEVFDSISVRQAEALAPDGSIPVEVTVSERKHRYFGVGATLSNTDGAGIEGYWGHRNLFGQAEKLRLQGSISRIGVADIGKLDYNAAMLFEKPGVIGPASKFTSNLRTTFEHPDAFDRFSVKGGVGLAYDLSKTRTVSGEVALDYSRIDDAFGSNRYLIASVPLQYAFDSRDDRLDPKAGFRLLALGEPAHDFLNGATFVKLRGEASVYQAVDQGGRVVVAGRVAAGTIAGADLASIPADRRFYAGGGGSVRGYGFQGIGPVDATGKPTGGLSLVETSAELRIRVTEDFGIVPFIDGGAVSTSRTPDFSDMRFGAGVGVRYLTPFGPLRVDVGVPLARRPGDPSFGIYAGIGQAF